MNKVILAYRKIVLQRLQLKALKDHKDSTRYSEQKRVFLLLLRPTILFSAKNKGLEDNRLYKYTNTLNSYCKNDHLYKMIVEKLMSSGKE
ncbi:MAG: hypothetical protein ACLTXM_21985 [Enterococcus sp.]